MRSSAILLIASLASVAAFTPMTPRALTARSAVRAAPQVVPKTALMSSMEDEDDVETSITRGGMIAGVGLPILFAPLAEKGGELGGAAIVVALTVVWVGLFVKLLQKVGL